MEIVRLRALTLIFSLTLFFSCQNEVRLNPKPRAYPRINFPDREYQTFAVPTCDFTFLYPSYTSIEYEESFFGEPPIHPCWFDIVYSGFNARIHISYLPIDSDNDYDQYLADVYRIAQQINLRSNFMNDQMFVNAHDVEGVLLDFEGPAASPVQFFLSDRENHFVKGALYYDTKVNVDSLAPITAFLEEDIDKLVSSFEFK